MRFLVSGSDFPAYSILRFIAGQPNAGVTGFVTEGTRSQKGLAFARENGVPIHGPDLLTDAAAWPEDLEADWLININGTVILRPGCLERFPGRALNMHPGPLPEYAGMHVHQWAIRNGEATHGATIHLMEAGVDTGPVAAIARFPILPSDTGLSLFMKTMKTGIGLLEGTLTDVINGRTIESSPQDLSRRRYFRHVDALGDTMDWRVPARRIVDFVRAGNYEPLSSPTYTPTMTLGDRQSIVVRNCRAVDRPGESADDGPGRVLRLIDAGPVVACGDGQAVLVDRALWNDRPVTPDMWRSWLKGT